MNTHYNTLKAVCPKGHPYDEANTIITPAGGRRCRACRNAQAIARNYRYRTDNPWGYRASQLNMKSKRLGLPGRVNADELREKWADGACQLQGPDCLGDATEWDHATPVTRFGASGGIENLLPACRACNARKNNLSVVEFKREARLQSAGRYGWIHPTAVIGDPPEDRDHLGAAGFYPVIDDTAMIEAFVTVDAGTIRATTIGKNSMLMKRVHIGHDVLVGDDCDLAPGAVVGGHAEIGDRAKVGMNGVILPYRKVGAGATIGAGAVVTKDIPPGEVWAGNPARPMPAGKNPTPYSMRAR